MKQERSLSVAVEGLLPSVVVPVGHLVSFRASDDAIEVLVGGAVLELRSAPFVVHVGAGVDVVPTTGKVAEALAVPSFTQQVAVLRGASDLRNAVWNYLGVDTAEAFAAWYQESRDQALARYEEFAAVSAERDALTEANLRLHEEHAAAIALLEEKAAPAIPDAPPAPPVPS